jgi:NADH-quinone oxidoreductase subunit G
MEMDGTFINNEGRAQRFRKVMQPGLPVAELLDAGHPPRSHRYDVPGGDVREARRVIGELLGRLGAEVPQEPLTGEWCRLRDLEAEGEGIRVLK